MSYERPNAEGMLSAPTSVASAKAPTPAKGTLDSQITLTGQATIDPMKGRFISESDPRAQAILAKRQEMIDEVRSKKTKPAALQFKSHVKHNKHGYGIVTGNAEGHRIPVMFASGKEVLVQIKNLEQV